MSKVVVAGKAIVINSGVKLEDLKLIKKFRPDALILKGGEDGKEQIFRIDVAENEAGNINKYGAVFGEATRDEGFATLTMIADFGEEDAAPFVADNLGCAIRNLNKLEESLPDVIAEISAEREAIINSVTVVN